MTKYEIIDKKTGEVVAAVEGMTLEEIEAEIELGTATAVMLGGKEGNFEIREKK